MLHPAPPACPVPSSGQRADLVVHGQDRRSGRPSQGTAPDVRVGLAGPWCGWERGYGLIAKLRVVQPELEALPPEAASIELPQTWPVVPVVGAAGSGVAAA